MASTKTNERTVNVQMRGAVLNQMPYGHNHHKHHTNIHFHWYNYYNYSQCENIQVLQKCCRMRLARAWTSNQMPRFRRHMSRKKWGISHVLQPAIEQPVVYIDPLILAFGDMIDTDWGRWKKYENMKLRINDQLCTSMYQLWFPTQSPTIF